MTVPTNFYNSALKNGTVTVTAEPTEKFTLGRSTGMRWNILTEPPPPELYDCDVVYCEPPYPAGIKIFDERAGESTSGFGAFAEGFAAVWSTIAAPKYAIVSSRLLKSLPPPDALVAVKLNKCKERLACWNGAPVPPEGMATYDVSKWLGKRFTRMADITCGYGGPLIRFCAARPGNSFFGADYDPHCITVLKRLALENIHGGS
jgi:hypothetical protein